MTDLKTRSLEASNAQARLKIDKLEMLKRLMECETPVEGGLGMDYTKRKAAFDDSEMQTLKDKIFDIVGTL